MANTVANTVATMRAVLSTGSNMDNPRAHLARVVEDFAGELQAVSSVYVTAPWGGVEQADFFNQILIVDVEATPLELLARCQSLEQKSQRVRNIRWGPRTLDVDIVALFRTASVGELEEITVATADLTVPHPRAHERAFVLIPWLEVDPTAVLGGTGVDKLLSALPPAEIAGVRKAKP